MGALDANRNTPSKLDRRICGVPLTGDKVFYKGALCVVSSGGYAKPGVTGTSLKCIGRAVHSYDTTGESDGDSMGEFEFGTFRWDNGESIDQGDVGKIAYITDDQTVCLTATGKSCAGEIVAVDSSGVWVYTSPGLATAIGLQGVDAGLSDSTPTALGVAATAGVGAAASRDDHVHAPYQIKTETIGHADLIDDVDDENQAINIGTALPATAIVHYAHVTLTTQFTGGGVTSVAMSVGWSGSAAALIKTFDAFGATASGAKYNVGSAASDLLINGPVPAGGKQLIATFDPDSGHDLQDLTAGALTVTVAYTIEV